MKLSVVIPAYNESENIKATIEEVLSITDQIPDVDTVQTIVVDDHSSDNTFNIVSELNDPRISCLRLSKQSGSATAFRAGIREARGDAVLCISADGQDNPSCLPEMLEKWRKGAKVVWALRTGRTNEAKHIRIPAVFFYKLLNLLGGNVNAGIDLANADFWLFDRVTVDAFNSCTERNTDIGGLIAWLGFNQDTVQYERRQRRHGKSKWNFRSRLRLAKDWIIAFSGLPLKLMPVVGFFVAALGFLFAIYILILYFTEGSVEGWTTIMVVILFLGGIQMIMLGIIGEYLWRNLEESRKRPLYFIEERTTRKGDPS